jgi:hypothetical protein
MVDPVANGFNAKKGEAVTGGGAFLEKHFNPQKCHKLQ